MPSSGTLTCSAVTIGSSVNNNYMYIDWSVSSQSTSGNYSVIAWHAYFHYTNSDAQLTNGSATLGGASRWSVAGTVHSYAGDFSTRNLSLASGSFNYAHASDGTATLTVSGSIAVYGSGTSSGSNSWALPTIPRFPGAPGTPTVSGHTDSNPTTATISWTDPTEVGGGLNEYHIQISTSNTFSSLFLDDSNTWDNGYAVTGLSKATTYYVRVRALSDAGYGPYSSTLTFTTGTTAPGAPGTPSVGTVTYTSIALTWSAPSDNGGSAITSYTLERATNSGFSTGFTQVTGLTSAAYTATGLTEGTTYYFRVKAINAVGTGSNSSTRSQATTAATAPPAPTALTPSNVTGTTVDLSWTPPTTDNGSPITSYTVERSTTSGSTGFGNAISGITGTSVQVTGLDYAVQYWFRVRAVNAKGQGTNSSSATATTGSTIPGAPSAPSVGTVTQTTASISWSAPSANGGSTVTSYDIQWATDSGFMTDVVTTTGVTSPRVVSNLIPTVTYYVRVRAVNANGAGAWSSGTSFATLASLYLGVSATPCQLFKWSGVAWVVCTTSKWSGTDWV